MLPPPVHPLCSGSNEARTSVWSQMLCHRCFRLWVKTRILTYQYKAIVLLIEYQLVHAFSLIFEKNDFLHK